MKIPWLILSGGFFDLLIEQLSILKYENKDHYTAVNRHWGIASIIDIALYILF